MREFGLAFDLLGQSESNLLVRFKFVEGIKKWGVASQNRARGTKHKWHKGGRDGGQVMVGRGGPSYCCG